MVPLIVFIGLIAAPILLLVILRVNAALVFLSLCLGAILVQFCGDDAASILAGASTSATLNRSVIQLALLLAPALLTMLFMIKSLTKSGKWLNILPAAGTGLLTALLVVPLLSPGLSANIVRLDAWAKIQPLESAIVALSSLVCLLFLIAHRPKHHDDKALKHHK